MKDKPTLLIVDDDKNTRDGLQRALQRNYTPLVAESAEAALKILAQKSNVDVMLSDLRMPGENGLSLLKQVQAHYPAVTCILLTAYGTVADAVEAMKQGAYDFLMKPINLDHLDLLLARAIHSRELEQKVEALETQLNAKYGMDNIIGESPEMQVVFETIRQAAPTQTSVLIQGASGTGKELVARAIHRLSTRSKGSYIAMNCSAFSPTLLESELFGHEKGAFTGAVAQRKGRFEMADGGTLFLDEVSEIDPALQSKLLRVLETREFERVGGERSIQVDIRLIAATNRNLKDYALQGHFREDLFYRLNVVDILLPSLSQRTGDIPLLAAHFLKEFCEKNGKQVEGFTAEALELLERYTWPGNVRELRNTIEKMVVLSRHPRMQESDVPLAIRQSVATAGVAVAVPSPVSAFDQGSLADVERNKILAVLAKNRGHRSLAADELGISRRTLYRKLKEYGVQE
jgi:DNA-binding NtrC family response regulator